MKRLNEVLQGKEENYMLPFFWQHGEDEETLRKYMHVIHDANIGAVCIESRPHPDFCGDKWWTDMDIILDEAEKLDMKVWILDDSHFPTGFANGAVEKAPKELHHQYMVRRTLEMAGPVKSASFSVKEYMQPAPLPPWIPAPPKSDDPFDDDKLMRIYACEILEGEVIGKPIDLTDKIDGDEITFDLGEGYFRIYVTYITRNAKGRNDYINFLDKESCRLLIDAVYEPHLAHYEKYFGNVIAGFFSDEPPVGNSEGYMPIGPIGSVTSENLAWSRTAEEKMTESYGSEEWKDFIPYLWTAAEDKEEQAKVRNAYMNMVTNLVAENFSAQNGAWCEDHGVEYIGHMVEDCDLSMNLGTSMGHFFRGLSGQHWAGVDNIGGQAMINGQNVPRHNQPVCRDEAGFYQYVDAKLGASHAAIDPKKRGICMCENFGAYGWQSGTKEQKYLMDHFMVRGVNRFVPHAFSPKAFPDPDCPPHFYAQGENPLYRAFGELMAYNNRVCHLIDGGKSVPDVALLYSAESIWAGDAASNIPAARYLSQSQVDFHIIPADVFAENEEYPMIFDGKTLKVNNVEYRALAISGCEFLEEHAAAFVEEAIKSNFPVIFTDCMPKGINGKVVPVQEVGNYLRGAIEIQTVVEPANDRITTYHYCTDTDTFLVLNEMSGSTFNGSLTVKAAGIPVRYYPWENKTEAAAYTKIDENTIRVFAEIQPLELCIICFVEEMQDACDAITFEKSGMQISEFEVTAVDSKDYLNQLETAGKGIFEKTCFVKPDTSKTRKVTAPFTGMQKANPEFSGYYIYETSILLSEGKSYKLVMDEVNESVEVFLNGRSLGMRLQAPFAFELPAELVEQDNDIRIEVATLNERKVKALGADISSMSVERPLSATGLVGNVTVYQSKS
ncbi:MAG: hypothetical protein PHQ72_05380 [Hespellia sp.]|nr:hypothetical protein [Hespellia sp.]